MRSDYLWHRNARVYLESALRSGLLTLVDIGSSKISCAVLRLNNTKRNIKPRESTIAQKSKNWEVIGHSVTQSTGVVAGEIVSEEKVEKSLRRALSKVYNMAGTYTENAIVSYPGHVTGSGKQKVSCLLSSPITHKDISKTFGNREASQFDHDQFTLHELPIQYQLDGHVTEESVISRRGKRLVIEVLTIAVSRKAIARQLKVLRNCGLRVVGIELSSFASGISVLIDQEQYYGSLVVDIGSEITGLTAFEKRRMAWSETISLGGSDITSDLSNMFAIESARAERAKVMQGSSITTQLDSLEQLSVIGGMGSSLSGVSITRSTFNEAICYRLEVIFEEIQRCLREHGWDKKNYVSLVFTGGCSKISGFVQFAQKNFSQPVRVGIPMHISKMPQAMRSEQFATLVGLGHLAISTHEEAWDYSLLPKLGYNSKANSLQQTVNWLITNW